MVVQQEELSKESTHESVVVEISNVPRSQYSTTFQHLCELNDILSESYEDVFFIAEKSEIELKEVTSSKIYSKKKSQSTSRRIPHEQGLFSEQIFGPTVSFKCHCSTIKVSQNEICPDCGVKITSSVERRKTYAKIPTLLVLSSQAAMLIKNVTFLNKVYENIITRKTVIISKNKLEVAKIVDRNKISQEELLEIYMQYPEEDYYQITVIYQLPMLIKNYARKNPTNSNVKMLVNLINSGRFFSDYILVIPPDLRPIYKVDDVGSNILNDINQIYLKILTNLEKNVYKDISGFDSQSLALIGNTIEFYVEILRKKMIDELKSKEGILRSTLAKRIDFSARGVIVPHNDRTNVIYVPEEVMLEILKLRISRNLSEKFHKPVQFFIPEIENVKNNIESQYEKDIIKEMYSILETDYVRAIINRQPTLHRGSMYCMKIKVWDHNAVGIPKTVCSSMNADFDGDTVAMYFILNEKYKTQAELISPEFNSINYQDLSYQLIPKQDIIYSFYKLTLDDERRKRLYDNNLLPEKYRDTVVDSKVMSKLLLDVNNIEYLDNIVRIANVYTDYHPITLSPLDFIYGKDKKHLRTSSHKLKNNVEHDFKVLKDIEDHLKDKFILSELITSGARGKFEQVRQLTHYRGYLTDFYGRLVETPIMKSYIDKFNIDDLYSSAKGVRKSLYDQHGTISKSGYLYRKLSFSSIAALKDKNLEDCGTKETIRITIPNESYAKTLIDRYYYEEDPKINENAELKQVKDYKSIVGKTIYLRSPITCSSEHYCNTCYPIKIQTPYIGLVASQSICERTSQLSLRTFHTSGIATGVSRKESKKAEDISNHLDYIIKHFDGSIELKSNEDLIYVLSDIQSILISYGNIQHIHLEVVSSERLFVELVYNDKKYIIPYRTYVNKFSQFENNFSSVQIRMYSVKEVPHLKSKTLGLLFQNTKTAVANLIKAKMSNEKIKTTPLDKIVLFFSSF